MADNETGGAAQQAGSSNMFQILITLSTYIQGLQVELLAIESRGGTSIMEARLGLHISRSPYHIEL